MSTFELLFLGTCACDFSPKLKTDFKDSFDFDARRASSVLVNENILIDCGPHCADSLRIARSDASKITDIFISHTHGDHLDVHSIEKIVSQAHSRVRLWAREDAELPMLDSVDVVRMKSFTSYSLADGITVTGMPANHDPDAFPQHFVLEKNGKRIFYGCDGAWLLTSVCNYLRGAGLSLMIMDATCGDYTGDFRAFEHNSIPMIRLILPSLKKLGIVNGETQILLSHIAPSLHKPHRDIAESVREDGLTVAYDGMQVEI